MSIHVKAYELLSELERAITKIIFENLQNGYGRRAIELIKKDCVDEFGLPYPFYFPDKIYVLYRQGKENKRIKRACERINSGFNFLKIRDTRNNISHIGIDDPITYAEYQGLVDYMSIPEFGEIGLDFTPLLERQRHNETIIENCEDQNMSEIKLSLPADKDAIKIPNNITRKDIEYIKTGFIGRQEDLVQIETSLFSRRTPRVVITAPGGVGKSALAIEFLRKISNSKKHHELLDAIVFVSLKQEYLLWDGVRNKSLDISLDAILANLHANVCKVLSLPLEGDILDLEDYRVLVCIDNLENVLLKNPKAFEEFMEDRLPQDWRYLLTSRIPVDQFKSHNLEYMGVSDATVLCQECFDLTSYRFSSDGARRETINKITNSSMGIPLAIKYSVDSIAYGGHEVQNAIQQSREEILNFSYSTFIESLGDDSPEARFVCALYVLGEPSNQSLICQVGEIDHEQRFWHACNRLGNLNIVTRDDLTNRYELSSSIRDFITRKGCYPDLIFDCKKRSSAIKISAQQAKESNSCGPFLLGYITPNALPELRPLISGVAEAIKEDRTEDLRDRWNTFNTRKSLYEESVDFNFFFGLISLKLDSYPLAEKCFENVARLDPQHWMARLMLGKTLRKMHNLPGALNVLLPIHQEGYGNAAVSSVFFAEELIRTLIRCFVYEGDFENALELTSGWSNENEIKRVHMVSRAVTLRRYAEKAAKEDDVDKYVDLIQEATYILNLAIQEFCGESDVLTEARKHSEAITSTLYLKPNFVRDDLLQCLGDFLEKFEDRINIKPEARRLILRLIDEVERRIDLTLVITKEFPDFLFGNDESGETCYIPKALKCLSDPSKKPFKGCRVIVKAIEQDHQRNRFRACMLLDVITP